jgi:hypothetical protein
MKVLDVIYLPKQIGQIGVEIEVEGYSLPQEKSVSKFWRKDVDGSLKGESAEYVLKKPVSLAELDKAFEELNKGFQDYESKVENSFRAGVHVHINVQDLSTIEVMNLIFTYLFLEEVLLSYCAKSRQGNHFCLRLSDAGYLCEKLTEAVMTENLFCLDTEDLRYASINVTSLFKYGSIEFRSLESTTDFSRIKDWAKVLYNLKLFAKTVKNPSHLLSEMSVTGFTDFARQAMGDCFSIMERCVSEEKIKKGVRNIQFAVYARDWDKKNLNVFQSKGSFS